MTEQDVSESALRMIIEAGEIASNLISVDFSKVDIEGLTEESAIKFDKEMLTKGQVGLVEIGKKLWAFQTKWINSDIHANAIEAKLFNDNKIDYNLMKKMMQRMSSGNSAITGLYLIKNFVHEYAKNCEKRQLQECTKKAQNVEELLGFEIDLVEKGFEKLKVQLDNVNLYHQNFMVSKAVKVAYASLFVSSLAFILTILQSLHII